MVESRVPGSAAPAPQAQDLEYWPFPPIGLSRVQASIHLGIEPNDFERLVSAGEMPQPRRLGSREVWHRQELEIAFAQLPAAGAPKAKGKVPTAGKPNAYSPRSLAERWICSEQHIRNMVKRGDIPAIQFGGKLIRIRAVDVDAYESGGIASPDQDGDEPVSPPAPITPRPRLKRLDVR